MRIKVAAKTDPGRLYDHNEDHFVLLRKAGLFLVADGVGGADAGELASQVACRVIQQSLHDALPHTDRPRYDSALTHAIRDANRGLHEYARHAPDKAGVGTTLTVLWFHGDRVLFAYVGDSRIYLFRDGVLRQLSRDEKAGRYRLAASLGQGPTVEPRLGMVRLRRGDRFLLCTDGLHGPVPHATLTTIVDGEPDPEDCCRRLIAAANNAGGPDNITALVADVVEPDPPMPWRFSRVRLDATSLLARLRRALLWVAIAVCTLAAVALFWWAAAQAPTGGGGEGRVAGRLALLSAEANRAAKAGTQTATLRALQDIVRAAIAERLALRRSDLALDPAAAALYDQAAKAVWDQLYAPAGKHLDQLLGSPAEPYVHEELKATCGRIDHVRKQFLADDFRFVVETFDTLEHEVATIASRARSRFRHDKDGLTKALTGLKLDASEFTPDTPVGRQLATALADAAKALDADDMPAARKAIAAARAALRRGLDEGGN